MRPSRTTNVSAPRSTSAFADCALQWSKACSPSIALNKIENKHWEADHLPAYGCTMKPENPTIEICPGITRRTVAHGDTMYQMLATLAAGSQMPAHSHPQEQIVHILEGKMRLIVEGVPHELSTGDSFYLASNVPHGVETLSATRVLDTFSPPRSDYLAMDQKVQR